MAVCAAFIDGNNEKQQRKTMNLSLKEALGVLNESADYSAEELEALFNLAQGSYGLPLGLMYGITNLRNLPPEKIEKSSKLVVGKLNGNIIAIDPNLPKDRLKQLVAAAVEFTRHRKGMKKALKDIKDLEPTWKAGKIVG